MNRYKTVAGEGAAEITEKKSRFITYVSPVCNESEAQGFIGKIRKKHYDASHNVFAYSVGLDPEYVKASDDGEPSGTAGAPMLDVLQKEGIKDCAVVVTRYFGGTLLGAGGLVRAYQRAAKEGLLASGVVERILCAEYGLIVDYHTYGKVKYELEKESYRIADIVYTDVVELRIIVETEKNEMFSRLIDRVCEGGANIEEKGKGYYSV